MALQNFNFNNVNNFQENSTDGMSPITDLANNLNSLSTNLPLTPCRRISFSDEHSSGHKSYPFISQESPFAIDSPSIQEGVLRGIELNVKRYPKEKITQSQIRFSCQQDKENHGETNVDKSSRFTPTKSHSSLLKSDSQSDFSGASQESGFCDSVFEKYSDFSFTSYSSVPSVRSSVFTDDDELDDDENFFAADKFLDDDDNASDVSSSMTQLLTKPLRESSNSRSKSSSSDNEMASNMKPPIRRCLSLVAPETFNCNASYEREKAFSSYRPITLDVEIASEDSCMEEEDEKLQLNPAKSTFKRPEPIDDNTPMLSKRRKSSPTVEIPSSLCATENKPSLHRCYSETAATIMIAVQKSDQQPNLIGDCSRPYALPLIPGRHQDLKTITSETLVRLIKGKFSCSVNNFTIIDCRYPYEYDGGHIIGARNIFTKDELYNILLRGMKLPENDQQSIIVFHCEFSSERAPKLLRYLRSKDRELNEGAYPRLHHPEIYLLEGGYRAFYEKFKWFCEPQLYMPMLHKDHSCELRQFRSKSKSFGNDFKMRPKLRSNLKF